MSFCFIGGSSQESCVNAEIFSVVFAFIPVYVYVLYIVLGPSVFICDWIVTRSLTAQKLQQHNGVDRDYADLTFLFALGSMPVPLIRSA